MLLVTSHWNKVHWWKTWTWKVTV